MTQVTKMEPKKAKILTKDSNRQSRCWYLKKAKKAKIKEQKSCLSSVHMLYKD